jgi:hypothetical protein
VDIAFWAVIGAMAYRHPDVLHWPDGFGHGPLLWTAVGGLTCFAYLTLDLIERAFEVHVRDAWRRAAGGTPQDAAPYAPPPSLTLIIQRNVRVRETHYALLAAAWLTHTVDILLAAYLVYYIVHSVALLARYRERGLTVAVPAPARRDAVGVAIERAGEDA